VQGPSPDKGKTETTTKTTTETTIETDLSVGDFPDDALRKAFIDNIYKSDIKVDQAKYRLFGAFDWELPKKVFFKKPLGENLCIIDLDNRPFDAPGGIFGPELMSWDDADKVHGLSTGVLNHWLYGMRNYLRNPCRE
jgi:hypothetical protein